jgi:Ku protein
MGDGRSDDAADLHYDRHSEKNDFWPGQDAFVIIRQVIEQMEMVAIGRVVLTSREHIIAMEPRGKGIMGTLLRYPYEVRDEKEFFEDISESKLGKDAMDLAKHIVQTKSGHFHPEKFEDRYEKALRDLIARFLASASRTANQLTQRHLTSRPPWVLMQALSRLEGQP